MDKFQITYLNEKVKSLLDDDRKLTKQFGSNNAKKIRLRLDDLDAALSMQDMRFLPGRWEELRGDRVGQFSARLEGGLRLIVRPHKQPAPSKPDGGMDWGLIDSICILEVVDYHD